ncbi:MAG: nucleotidyl transferase AbiEii/AbiGii toxin family protein, partial [Deltaproteobacteria bacterium]|nr:nucleotidyl transferase AbiEii/AbiGii toxin family protein [Deltaproteobacteria bacterium]
LKDYFDIAWLVEHFEFEFEQVRGAIVHTFERRGSSLPKQLPLGLTESFATDAQKNIQWRAFLKKTHAHQPKKLAETIDAIVRFLEPVITSLSQDNANKMNWTSTEGWVKIERQQGEAE